MIRNSNDETNFPHKLLLTDTQVSKICEPFVNGSSANIKCSKTQLSEMIQSGGFNILDLMNPAKAMNKIDNKVKDLFNKVALDKIYKVIKIADVYRKIVSDFKRFFGTEITLTKNEIK